MRLPDIPFELILFLLFFVLPGLGGLLRNRNKDKQEGQAPRPTAASERSDRVPSSNRPSPTATTRSETGGGWLEEAQRRVAEARQGEAQGQQRSAHPTTLSERPSQAQQRQTPSPRPVAPPRTLRERSLEAQGSLEGRSLETRNPGSRGLESRSLENRSLETISRDHSSLETRSLETRSLETLQPNLTRLSEAPPIHVQRLKNSKHATITRQELRFDAHDLAKGLIWHQVLSPPRSTIRRTRLSRRRP